ncbi:MAG: methylenetetrahydrofolate reductase [NAD(P)H] [Coxiellaceae bacterium]|nr:methylenetetrahydrofolate reductase [NAD(P)H] [Coxiellaceae bacterium]
MDVSFEFFPPKTDEGLQKLVAISKQLSAYSPSYFSVTYGAGGSTQRKTIDTVAQLRQMTSHAIAPHISCVGATKVAISALLDEYRDLGVRKIVVLRGDLPSGEMDFAGTLRYANQLVSFIREYSDDFFHIEVAGYPECHPQSKNFEKDFFYFKQKVDSGANGVITQYFYDVNAYYWLLEACHRHNIRVPITPGIMPITNIEQLIRFSHQCGAQIPRWLIKRCDSYGDDIESIKQFGMEVVTRLCEQLIAIGVPGLHFYTLNKVEASMHILDSLKIARKTPEKELAYN